MHSHHSHSGDYVAHGVDPLDEMMKQVERMKFHTYCLTEHIPRIESQYLYPEEIEENGENALAQLQTNFNKFMEHAQRIKSNNETNGGAKIIIGTEIESCDTQHIDYAKTILAKNSDVLKFCVGSVHHINGIPLDFDQENWDKCLESFKDRSLKQMLISYFESQYEMLTVVQPKVVGHFDLFKLLWPQDLKVDPVTGNCTSDSSGIIVTPLTYLEQWKDVKDLVVRNLKCIDSYGGAIEINTSALRKGLEQPYPSSNIGELVKQYCHGRFVLSDDAHGIKQVGVCYKKALNYIQDVLKLDKMHYMVEDSTDGSIRFESLSIEEFADNQFWKLLG